MRGAGWKGMGRVSLRGTLFLLLGLALAFAAWTLVNSPLHFVPAVTYIVLGAISWLAVHAWTRKGAC